MSHHRPIADFIAGIQPLLHHAGRGHGSPSELLEETVEELQVAVEELRVAEEDACAAMVTADRERRESLRFRDAFDAAPAALLLTDRHGSVMRANARAAALLGTELGQLEGKPLAVYVEADGSRAFRRLLLQMARAVGPRTQTLVLHPRRGPPLEAEATTWPIAEAGERVLAWSLAQEPLRPAAEPQGDELALLRGTLDSLPDAVAAMDLDGSVLAWNRAAQRLLGWSEDEVVGRPNPALPDELLPMLDSVRAVGMDPSLSLTVTTVAERKDGHRGRLDVSVSALAGPEGRVRGTVAVMRPASPAGAEAGEDPSARAHWPAAELRRVLFGGAASGDVAERLRDGIAAALDLGYLRPGDRLPGTREAAAASAIDHRVISAAYRRLAAEGLVEVRPRRGPVVAPAAAVEAEPLGETPEWLAAVLEGAAQLQVRVPALADLVRRWTAQVPVRCLCVDATEDGRAALAHEMAAQWGMECTALSPDERGGQRELASAIRASDLVVTTHYAAGAVRARARGAGKPVVVAAVRADLVEALEEALRRGPVAAVVADEAFAERLRVAPGGERLEVVLAGDELAVEALPADRTVLLTLAAQQKVKRTLRLLAAPGHFVAPLDARALARVLIRANLRPARSPAG